ncbi:hypothetical protein TrRE_jg5615, partial [Triparma retinervis]
MEPTPSPARRASLSANTIVSTVELHNNDMWTPERVFQALDKDGSSSLDVVELTIGLTAVLGRRISAGEAERVFNKADTDSDGKLGYGEFEKFCKSGKLGKSFVGYFSNKKKAKGGVVHADDFSCPGLYRFSKTKKASKNAKVMQLLERAQRVPLREFRDAVGQNGAVVASGVVDLLNDYAPLVPYNMYEELTACKGVKDLKLFFQRSVEDGIFKQIHLDFLGSLCIHLYDLLKFKERNMMGIESLKQLISHLVCRRNEDGTTGDERDVERGIKDRAVRGELFALMVTNSEELFGEREEFMWGQRERKDPERKSAWKNSTRTSSGEANYSALVLEKGKIKFAGKDRTAEVMLTKAEEMAIILKAGEASDPAVEGGRWYIVESKFVYNWLAYVALKEKIVEGTSERPRCIDNTTLLGVQETTKLFYLKEDKKCASDRHPGDYRLVNQQTWKKFCSLYPGSGPAVYVEDGDKDDLFHFYIDQLNSPYAKEREVTEDNEFDEFTMGNPVFKRNRGPNGSGFDFYRDSGLEDIFRASGDFIGGVVSL